MKLHPSRRKSCVHHATMLHATSCKDIRKVYACLAVTCHLTFLQNDRDLLRATVVTGGGTDTEIRVSTESRPWRRKLSRRSSRDSNPRPFNHESGALTSEVRRSQILYCLLTVIVPGFRAVKHRKQLQPIRTSQIITGAKTLKSDRHDWLSKGRVRRKPSR